MIINFSQFINENINIDIDTKVRIMSWLYLVSRYKNGLERGWYPDERMGIRFGESIDFLYKNQYIYIDNDICKITKKGIDELYNFFKVPKTRDEFFNYDNNWLIKYDIKYPISHIPILLYEHNDNNYIKKYNYMLSEKEYKNISYWWDDYQFGNAEWVESLKQYLGYKGDLIPDVNEMTLYRGINII